MLCEGAKASRTSDSPIPVAEHGVVKVLAVGPGYLGQEYCGSLDLLLLSIKDVSAEIVVLASSLSLCPSGVLW